MAKPPVFQKIPGDESELPLYNLGFLPLENVFQHVSLKDILECSSISSEMNAAIRQSDLKLSAIRIAYDAVKPVLKLQYKDKFYEWAFFMPAGEEPDKTRKAGRQAFRVCEKPWGVHADHHDIEHSLTRVFTHFVGFFDCTDAVLWDLHIDLSVIEDIRLLLEHFKHFKRIRRVSLVRSGPFDRLGKELIPVLEYILAKLHPEQFHLGIDITGDLLDDRFQLDRLEDMMLTKEHLSIDFPGWMTKEKLFKFGGKTLMLGNPSVFTARDFQRFIDEWKVSPVAANLEWIFIRTTDIHYARFEEGGLLRPARRVYKRLQSQWLVADGQPFDYYFPVDTRQVVHSNETLEASLSCEPDVFVLNVTKFGPITAPIIPRKERQLFFREMFRMNQDVGDVPPDQRRPPMPLQLIVPHDEEEKEDRTNDAAEAALRLPNGGGRPDLAPLLDEDGAPIVVIGERRMHPNEARRRILRTLVVSNDLSQFEWTPARERRIEVERRLVQVRASTRHELGIQSHLSQIEMGSLEAWVNRELALREDRIRPPDRPVNNEPRPIREVMFTRLSFLLEPSRAMGAWNAVAEEVEFLLDTLHWEIRMHERRITEGVGDEMGFLRSDEWAATKKLRRSLEARQKSWREATEWNQKSYARRLENENRMFQNEKEVRARCWKKHPFNPQNEHADGSGNDAEASGSSSAD